MTEIDPLRISFPYIPLHISGDVEGNAQRQAEADQINRTTNRTVDLRRDPPGPQE